MNWPWTNVNKKLADILQQRTEECKTFVSVDELFEHIKSIKQPWYQSLYNRVVWELNDWTWGIYRMIRPCHANVRSAIPRTWADLTEVIRYVNFAIIKDFFENETDFIDWDADDDHKKFYAWLKDAYEYVCTGRPALEIELQQAYDRVDHKMPVAERYALVQAIEEKMEQQDTQVLVSMMQHRQYFWS